MVKELLNGKIRVGIVEIKFEQLDDISDASLGKKAELKEEDTFMWKSSDKCLRIECKRHIFFHPASKFDLYVTYCVEHFLKEEGSLKKIEPNIIKQEILSDYQFFLQENQGFGARASLLIAEIIANMGGAPLIIPPVLDKSDLEDSLIEKT